MEQKNIEIFQGQGHDQLSPKTNFIMSLELPFKWSAWSQLCRVANFGHKEVPLASELQLYMASHAEQRDSLWCVDPLNDYGISVSFKDVGEVDYVICVSADWWDDVFNPFREGMIPDEDESRWQRAHGYRDFLEKIDARFSIGNIAIEFDWARLEPDKVRTIVSRPGENGICKTAAIWVSTHCSHMLLFAEGTKTASAL